MIVTSELLTDPPNLTAFVGAPFLDCELIEPMQWCFTFGGGYWVTSESLWRLVTEDRIEVTSEDHGHQFGLPSPVDAADRVKNCLAGVNVSEIAVAPKTSDLRITFSNGCLIELLNGSCGYESWQLGGPEVENIIGMGGGQLAIVKACDEV